MSPGLKAQDSAWSDVRVVACPHPFSVERIERQVSAGRSVAAILREIGLDHDPIHARVFLDDQLVPKAYWERVRPKPGHALTVRVVPTGGGGGGKDLLRIVAVLAVAALAIAAPYLAPESWGLVTAQGGLTLLGRGVAAGIGLAGAFAVGAHIPPPLPRRQLPLPTTLVKTLSKPAEGT